MPDRRSTTQRTQRARVGKLADFVGLSDDPYRVDPGELAETVSVLGTWLGGQRIDLGTFLAAAGAQDPAPHQHLTRTAHARHCC